MKYSKVVIDISNLYGRAYHTSPQMTSVLDDGTEIVTGGIYTSMKMIQKIERDYLSPLGEVYFVFDNHYSGENKRKQIDPDYKVRRQKKDESYYRGIDLLHFLLMNYKDNYVVIKRPGSEADDLVSPLVSEFDSSQILLVSNDMDWFRLIGENVHVAKYEKKEYVIYDQEVFNERFGFYPTEQRICLYKCFRGDASDNIPKGVPGIREETLVRIVRDFSSLKEIFSSMYSTEYINDTWRKKIEAGKSRLRLNMKLVSFEKIPYEELKEYMFFSKFSPRSLRSLYKSLNFSISSFDPRITQFFPDKKEATSFFQYERIPRA